ncbi:MAG: gliding motility protein GldC [Cytophagales bacterium]|nr:MAG: gliding motility protein GldC [Cytophagales bacterium]
MKKSDIHFSVELDNQNVPDKIYWDATDNPNEGLSDTRAIAVSIWDHYHQGTLKMDLWTKDMEVLDMKRFVIEIMDGLASTIESATGDEPMARDIMSLCQVLSRRVKEEMKQQQQK